MNGSLNLKPQWFRICREQSCQRRIGFNPSMKSVSGALIPLEENGARHTCSNSSYQRRMDAAEGQDKEEPSKAELRGYFNEERIVLDVMSAVMEANGKLDSFYLKVERVPKTQGQTTLG